ncbi:hypothetical protein [Gluconobacter sp. DsW_056]|uniref:hypothetical protein n=1 Tax=Gluconobacter sp. DsW_056 TaxID=1511209 RepID=UPI00117BD20F|nr:hypothetical protein [Gluconobacter sp. DsW_056]
MAKAEELKTRLTVLHKSIQKAESDGESTDELEKEFDETEDAIKSEMTKAKRSKAAEDIEAEKSKDADEADSDDEEVSASVSKSFGISKGINNRADSNPLKMMARAIYLQELKTRPETARQAQAIYQKSFGSRDFETISKASTLTTDGLTLQAPNYDKSLLISLLNKNIVTDAFTRNVEMVNNNFIAPRMVTGSTGSFNSENGLISVSDIGTDVIAKVGKYYGSIITSTRQALAFSGDVLEDMIVNEMQSRYKLVKESIILNSDGSDPTVPTGAKGYAKQTQNIIEVDFSALTAEDEATSVVWIQKFASAISNAAAKKRNAGDYSQQYCVIPEILRGVIEARASITGNFVYANIIANGLFGVKFLSSSNLSTNETSDKTGSAVTTNTVAPAYMFSENEYWVANGNFYAFDTFDAGTITNGGTTTNLIQQNSRAWRLYDSFETALTRDVCLTRIEFNGACDVVDNSSTFTEQTPSGVVASVPGLGKKTS